MTACKTTAEDLKQSSSSSYTDEMKSGSPKISGVRFYPGPVKDVESKGPRRKLFKISHSRKVRAEYLPEDARLLILLMQNML